MASKQKKREKLVKLLQELFQLDQPELDFGFYRIMHLKSKEVTAFLEKDLLKYIEDAFGKAGEAKKVELEQKYKEEIEKAKEYGVENPEESPKVKEAWSKYQSASDMETAETEIYDHLYRFFERYYDSGDFMSRRYHVRETSDKAAPYAIPYDGSEVMLHWANADQYYIKTAEYFNNYTFKLRPESTDNPLRIHFKIVDATEGEHGNIKASNDQERFFIIHEDLVAMENGELIIRFEYRFDPEQSGQSAKWQEKRRDEAVEKIFKAMDKMDEAAEYFKLLSAPAPTDKQKDRTLLAKYLAKYTARNTMDYFIHKDLGGFLNRELDFYIKNEIMRLDDIESADAPTVEQYLSKIKVLRTIAHKMIEFLAQLENFQKKLWLKKKFVVETNYCITLDRVSEELYPEIAANDSQREEWIKLFAIDEIKKDLAEVEDYSEPLTVEFLKANPYLILDTKFFNNEFILNLLTQKENLDEQCDGLLIHSENFQALNLMQERYREQVKCIYTDPPYNSAATEILYKNSYKHSSWCSLLFDRIFISKELMSKNGIIEIAIDDMEFHRLEGVVRAIFGDENYIANIAIMHNPKGRDQQYIADCHDYTIIASKNYQYAETFRLKLSDANLAKKYSKGDKDNRHRELPLRRSGSGAQREDRPYMFFPFLYEKENKKLHVLPKEEYQNLYDGSNFNDDYLRKIKTKYETSGYIFILPIRDDRSMGRWRWGYDTCTIGCEEESLIAKLGVNPTIYQLDNADDTYLPKSLWFGERFDASTKGTNLLKDIVGKNDFDYPKSIYTVEDMVTIGSDEDSLILDYFGGSGTTAHAAISLFRQTGNVRKYIVVEMGNHFYTVLKPRIQKVVYSKDWKDGKPMARDMGISHCFKYIRLESYEDTLNNLEFKDDKTRISLLEQNDKLREDYMLQYMLDDETHGSQSLLNIDKFADPTAYKLKVKKPGSDEYEWKNVDLLETFNYLIGLRVEHIAAPQTFTADFKREPDPELPDDQNTKLILDGKLKQDRNGPWWFRKVEGWVPADLMDLNNGHKEKVLIVWRKLTGDMEKDNLMLDEWFTSNRINTRDFEFDIIYVNGSNNLPNLKQEGDNWKVRLIEEDFHKRMWDVEDV